MWGETSKRTRVAKRKAKGDYNNTQNIFFLARLAAWVGVEGVRCESESELEG